MTTDAKIAALRAEADNYGDSKTVELCDLALSGDAAARKAVAAMTRSTARKAKASSGRVRSRARGFAVTRGVAPVDHPWAHDEE